MPYYFPKRPYTIEQIKELNHDQIYERCAAILVDFKSLQENIDLFIECSRYVRSVKILALDYESVSIIDQLAEKNILKQRKVFLLDDYEQRDRSYIDTTKFKNITLYVPNTYAMWGVKFDDRLYCYQYLYRNYNIENDTFSGYYDRETLIEVERIAMMISDFSENLTDIEKIILISNYLQKYCYFKMDNLDISEEELGDPKTALVHNFGVCRTFADATTLLSNNPYLKLKVRNIRSKDNPVHVWNTIELNGLLYQIDNARAISAGKNTINNRTRTTKFNSEYLLFGERSLNRLHHEQILYNLDTHLPLSEDDYDRGYIEAAIEYIDETGMVDFDYEKKHK